MSCSKCGRDAVLNVLSLDFLLNFGRNKFYLRGDSYPCLLVASCDVCLGFQSQGRSLACGFCYLCAIKFLRFTFGATPAYLLISIAVHLFFIHIHFPALIPLEPMPQGAVQYVTDRHSNRLSHCGSVVLSLDSFCSE